VAYLRTAPDGVKQIVENMLPNEHAKSEFWAIFDTKADNCCEETAKLQSSEIDGDQDIRLNTCKIENVQESVGFAHDKEEKVNPYLDMDFSKRLELDELRVKITNDVECHLHGIPYEKIQVVLLYGGGKKYGSYLQCCPICKKLFIKEEDFRELETKLKEKNIKYLVD
jgi:hypothetical protein